MQRIPEVEITRSLSDPASRINAFIDCADMLAWEHWIYGNGAQYMTGRSMSKATMVFANIDDGCDSVTWKFKFRNMEAAKAFDEGFG